MGQFWGMEQQLRARGDTKGVPSWGGCPSEGALMLPLEPSHPCSLGALCQHQACAIMGKLPAECFFNLERNNLISNYWCRTLGESLQRMRTGCFTGAACHFCHLIIRLFHAKTLDRQRGKKKILSVIVLVIFYSH